jgi:hypothetical protein
MGCNGILACLLVARFSFQSTYQDFSYLAKELYFSDRPLWYTIASVCKQTHQPILKSIQDGMAHEQHFPFCTGFRVIKLPKTQKINEYTSLNYRVNKI